jgi:hypothetical protein
MQPPPANRLDYVPNKAVVAAFALLLALGARAIAGPWLPVSGTFAALTLGLGWFALQRLPRREVAADEHQWFFAILAVFAWVPFAGAAVVLDARVGQHKPWTGMNEDDLPLIDYAIAGALGIILLAFLTVRMASAILRRLAPASLARGLVVSASLSVVLLGALLVLGCARAVRFGDPDHYATLLPVAVVFDDDGRATPPELDGVRFARRRDDLATEYCEVTMDRASDGLHVSVDNGACSPGASVHVDRSHGLWVVPAEEDEWYDRMVDVSTLRVTSPTVHDLRSTLAPPLGWIVAGCAGLVLSLARLARAVEPLRALRRLRSLRDATTDGGRVVLDDGTVCVAEGDVGMTGPVVVAVDAQARAPRADAYRDAEGAAPVARIVHAGDRATVAAALRERAAASCAFAWAAAALFGAPLAAAAAFGVP